MADLTQMIRFIFQAENSEAVILKLQQIEGAVGSFAGIVGADLNNAIDRVIIGAKKLAHGLGKGEGISEAAQKIKELKIQYMELIAVFNKNKGNAAFPKEQMIDKIYQLSSAINKAESNFVKISKSMISARTDAEKIGTSFATAGTKVSGFRGMVNEARASLEKMGGAQTNLNTSLDNAIGKLIKYRLTYLIFRKAVDAAKESLETFATVNTQLAQLEKVLDPATSNIEELRDASFALGEEFSVSAEKVLKAFVIWAQVGLSQQEVLEATRTTLVGVNAIGFDTVEMTEALTSVMFTYGIEVQNTMQYVNEWMRVQAKFPTSAQDLAGALKAVGSAAKEVGVDLTELSGYVVAINAITRKSGTAIGQSLKTMFARMVKPEYIALLQDVGIAVKANADEFRDIDDVLDELSEKWSTLTGVQKTNIAQQAGGIRRYVDFLALMDAYALKQQAIVEAHLTTDEAFKASDIEVATYTKQMEALKVTMSDFGEVFGKELAVGIIDVIQSLAAILKILKPLAPLFGAIIRVGGSMALIFGTIKIAAAAWGLIQRQVTIALAQSTVAVSSHSAAVLGLAGVTTTATGANIGFAASIRAVMGALGPIALALSLVGGAIATYYSLARDSNETFRAHAKYTQIDIEALTKNIKARRAQNDIIDESVSQFEILAKKYQTLKSLGKDITETEKQMSVQGDLLSSINTDLAISVDRIIRSLDVGKIAFDALYEAATRTKGINQSLANENEKILASNKKVFELTYDTKKASLEASINGLQKAEEDIIKAIESPDISILKDRPVALNIDDMNDAAKELLTFKLKFLKEFSPFLSKAEVDEINGRFDEVGKGIETFASDISYVYKTLNLQDYENLPLEELFKVDPNTAIKAEETIKKFKSDAIIMFGDLYTGVSDKYKEDSEALDKLIKQKNIFASLEAIEAPTAIPTKFYEIPLSGLDELKTKLQQTVGDVQLMGDSVGRLIKYNEQMGSSAKETASSIASYYKAALKTFTNVVDDINTKKIEIGFIAEEFENKFISDYMASNRVLDFEKLKGLFKDLDGVVAGANVRLNVLNEMAAMFFPIIFNGINMALVGFKKWNDMAESGVKGMQISNLYNKLTESTTQKMVELYKLLGKSQKDIVRYQIDALKISHEERRQAILLLEAEDQEKALNAESVDYAQKRLELEQQLAAIDYTENIKKAVDAQKELQNTLSKALSNVPKDMSTGFEKRRDISQEIKDIEKEINAARADGDRQEVQSLENKKKELQQQLDSYRAGLYELAQFAKNITEGLSTARIQALSDNIADALSDIDVGGVSIGARIGAAIANVETKYLTQLDILNVTMLNRQQSIFDEFIWELGAILNEPITKVERTPFGTSEISLTEESDKLKIGFKALKDYIETIAGTMAGTALGGGGTGASTGASLGSTIGGLISGLGIFGGPLGGIVGGLFGGLLDSEKDLDKDIVDLGSVVIENTHSIDANTDALKQLDSVLFNAPSTFVLPTFSTQGAPSREATRIVIYANDAGDVAKKVGDLLNKQYSVDVRTSRTNKRYDI